MIWIYLRLSREGESTSAPGAPTQLRSKRVSRQRSSTAVLRLLICTITISNGRNFPPQHFMSLRDTPNHEKARRMGGAERNPSSLFIAETQRKRLNHGWTRLNPH